MKESDLGQVAMSWLRDRGWRCYGECELIAFAPIDLVATKRGRVLLIELKPRFTKQFEFQMRRKYRYFRQKPLGANSEVIAMTGKRSDNLDPEHADWEWRRMALEDGQLHVFRSHQDHFDHDADKWVYTTEWICHEKEVPRHARGPVDKRARSILLNEPESYTAGTSTGSKNHSLWNLVMNWARVYPEKLANLKTDEAHRVISMWLPTLPMSYAKAAVVEARGLMYEKEKPCP